MKNIIADVKNWIVANITLYGKMTVSNYGTATESLMIKGDPSSVRETSYMDGGCIGTQNASIYARSMSDATAIAALDIISDEIEYKDIELNELETVKIEVMTSPQFVSKTEAGAVVYTIALKIEYERS
jgi:hypothetical protein